ncbi:MAG: TonB-dependent receptor [Lentimicrobiaceae bacterium]|jgi:hypothetical protein|nr:TonB-dependent receptor [Lentimicrobiaceae bacterium]MDD4599419.1 TonB-dependent receptor [Lentimicrobiaceae bacterium]
MISNKMNGYPVSRSIVLLGFIMIMLMQKGVTGQTISGFVSDSKSGERLLYAGIYEANTARGTSSNGYGFFSITTGLPQGEPVVLVITYVGYLSDTLLLTNLIKDTLVNIRLKAGVELKPVEIISGNNAGRTSSPGMHRLTAQVIKSLPALGGETDLIKVYQLTPGVQQGHEGTSGLHVRGGSPDQNLVMLDDVPLYNINHLGGFISAFNTDAIKSSTLIKGGFPSKYGGRLSSVLDVNMADGNLMKTGGNVSLGLVSARFTANGPIQKNKASYLISFRRFYFDLIARPLAKKVNPGSTIGYNFYDLNIKLNKILDTRNKIHLSFYTGDDKTLAGFKEKKDDGTDYYLQTNRWGNVMSAIRWNHIFNSRVFSNTTLHFSRYRVNNELISESGSGDSRYSAQNSLLSAIGEYSLKSEIEFYSTQKTTLFAGVQLTSRYFKPNNYSYSASGSNSLFQPIHSHQLQMRAFEGIVYAGGRITLSSGHNLEFGSRINTFAVHNRFYIIPEPRIKASFNHSNRLTSFAAFDVMSQNMHITGNNSIGMPVNYLLPATGQLPPSVMKQLSAGSEFVSNHKVVYSTEVYYKYFSRLAMLKDGASLWEGRENWENLFAKNGTGRAFGAEFMAAKNHGNPTGWISYTLARSDRKFEEINQGKLFPDQFDIRHSINLALMVKIDENADFSCAWVFNSGYRLTLPVSKYYVPVTAGDYTHMNEMYIYSERNAFKTKPYHRLDISFNFHKQKKRYLRTFTLGIINLYNQRNPNAYYFSTMDVFGPNNTRYARVVLMQRSFFPFMPNVGWSFRF